jgi:hypothetical protein
MYSRIGKEWPQSREKTNKLVNSLFGVPGFKEPFFGSEIAIHRKDSKKRFQTLKFSLILEIHARTQGEQAFLFVLTILIGKSLDVELRVSTNVSPKILNRPGIVARNIPWWTMSDSFKIRLRHFRQIQDSVSPILELFHAELLGEPISQVKFSTRNQVFEVWPGQEFSLVFVIY